MQLGVVPDARDLTKLPLDSEVNILCWGGVVQEGARGIHLSLPAPVLWT